MGGAMNTNTNALARRVASAIFILWLAGCAHTEVHTQACLTGVDVYESTASGSNVGNVTFSGTDGRIVEPCQGTTAGQGGFWTASFDRADTVSLAQDAFVEATILGGEWHWWPVDGPLQSGSVTGGRLLWPTDMNHNIGGCGYGVAQISVTLTVRQDRPGTGTFEGCLDTTQLDPTLQWIVYPPRIWGKLTLSAP